MTKTAKVTNVTRNQHGDYTNKDGKQLFCFNVEFDNSDAGETHSTNSSTCKFVTGQSASYEIEPIMSKRNPNEVWKYKVKYVTPPDQRGGAGGGYKSRELSPEQQKSIACQVAYEVAIDFAIAKGESKIRDNMAHLTNWLVSKGLTGDVQKRACGCLRLAVRMMKIESFKSWDIQTLMKAAEDTFNTCDPEKFKV